jgi:hypothetical protein
VLAADTIKLHWRDFYILILGFFILLRVYH